MGRRKKNTFDNVKMLSSRIELSDYIKFEEILYPQYGKRVKMQDIMNAFVRSCISGSIVLSKRRDSFIGRRDWQRKNRGGKKNEVVDETTKPSED